jgi:hypothetical protein
VLRTIAESQAQLLAGNGESLGSDLAWLRSILWARDGSHAVKKTASTARFDASFYPLNSHNQLECFCCGEFKHIKKKGSCFELPPDDTDENKRRRCDLLLAALPLASLQLQPVADSLVLNGLLRDHSTVDDGKRAPEQRDPFFLGRERERNVLCSMIDSVLFKKNSDCDDAAHAAVIGFPGMGKSLLVSQALLHSQQLQCDSLRNVFIMKLRGRGAVSVSAAESGCRKHLRPKNCLKT